MRKKCHFEKARWSKKGLSHPRRIIGYTGKRKPCGLNVFPGFDEETPKIVHSYLLTKQG